MGSFLVANRASVWLIFASSSLTAVMMQPSGAAAFVVCLNLLILGAIRQIAIYEGSHPS